MLASMDLENQERQRQELMRNEAAKQEVADANMDNPVEEVVPDNSLVPYTPKLTPAEKAELAKQETARIKTDEMIRLEQARSKLNQKAREKAEEIETYSIPASENIQEPPTADTYGQDVTENQTEEGILDKKMEQGAEIATEGDTVAKVLSENQDSQPSKFTNPKEVQRQMESDMVGASVTSKKVSEFLGQKGLEPL